MIAYSWARAPWTPRLLVKTTLSGSQSNGVKCSTPAPVAWIQRSSGARAAMLRWSMSQHTSAWASAIWRSKSAQS